MESVACLAGRKCANQYAHAGSIRSGAVAVGRCHIVQIMLVRGSTWLVLGGYTFLGDHVAQESDVLKSRRGLAHHQTIGVRAKLPISQRSSSKSSLVPFAVAQASNDE